MVKRTFNKRGETLVETLCAIAILSIVISAFATVITEAAYANKKISNSRVTFSAADRTKISSGVYPVYIKIGNSSYNFDSKTGTSNGVQWYSDGEMYYYEFEQK